MEKIIEKVKNEIKELNAQLVTTTDVWEEASIHNAIEEKEDVIKFVEFMSMISKKFKNAHKARVLINFMGTKTDCVEIYLGKKLSSVYGTKFGDTKSRDFTRRNAEILDYASEVAFYDMYPRDVICFIDGRRYDFFCDYWGAGGAIVIDYNDLEKVVELFYE